MAVDVVTIDFTRTSSTSIRADWTVACSEGETIINYDIYIIDAEEQQSKYLESLSGPYTYENNQYIQNISGTSTFYNITNLSPNVYIYKIYFWVTFRKLNASNDESWGLTHITGFTTNTTISSNAIIPSTFSSRYLGYEFCYSNCRFSNGSNDYYYPLCYYYSTSNSTPPSTYTAPSETQASDTWCVIPYKSSITLNSCYSSCIYFSLSNLTPGTEYYVWVAHAPKAGSYAPSGRSITINNKSYVLSNFFNTTTMSLDHPTKNQGDIIQQTDMNSLKYYKEAYGITPNQITQDDIIYASDGNTYKNNLIAGTTQITASWYNDA